MNWEAKRQVAIAKRKAWEEWSWNLGTAEGKQKGFKGNRLK